MIMTGIQNETRNVAPIAIEKALQTVPRDLERGLAPVIQRAVVGMVHSAVENAMKDALERSLLPAVAGASERLGEKLTADFTSEMIQLATSLSFLSR